MDVVRSADGTELAVERRGQGPAVVLVGGALADRRATRALAGGLAASCTAISYDRRGRGESGDRPPYAIEREVEDLAAVVATAGASPAVYGHSSGAMLALAASCSGVPVARLAVYEPPFLTGAARARLDGEVRARLSALLGAGRRDEAVRWFLTEAVAMPADELGGLAASPGWKAALDLAHTLVHDVLLCAGPDAVDEGDLGSIVCPTLVLDGGASPAWVRAAARLVASVVPDSSATTLAGQGHRPASGVLAPVLTAFVLGRL